MKIIVYWFLVYWFFGIDDYCLVFIVIECFSFNDINFFWDRFEVGLNVKWLFYDFNVLDLRYFRVRIKVVEFYYGNSVKCIGCIGEISVGYIVIGDFCSDCFVKIVISYLECVNVVWILGVVLVLIKS